MRHKDSSFSRRIPAKSSAPAGWEHAHAFVAAASFKSTLRRQVEAQIMPRFSPRRDQSTSALFQRIWMEYIVCVPNREDFDRAWAAHIFWQERAILTRLSI